MEVPNLEQSGAAFPPMSPDVMGALMSDEVVQEQQQTHPSAQEIAEEQWMYSNALHEAERHTGLPPPHTAGAAGSTSRPTLWTETPPRVRVGSTTSAYKQALPQNSPASTSSFASPGTQSQGRTPLHQPALQKQSSNQPLMTLQMLQHDQSHEEVLAGRNFGSNIRLSLSGSAHSEEEEEEEEGEGDEGHQHSGDGLQQSEDSSGQQETTPYSDGDSLDIEDEEV